MLHRFCLATSYFHRQLWLRVPSSFFPLDESPMMCIKNFPLPSPPIQLSCRVTFASSSKPCTYCTVGSVKKGGICWMECPLSSWWLVILGSTTWLYDHRQGDWFSSRPTAMSPWLVSFFFFFFALSIFPLNSVAWKSLAVPGWPVSSLYTGCSSKRGKKEKEKGNKNLK